MPVSNATPLIALDAVVIDTKTTGLDPGKARVVNIAAVRIIGGRLDPSASFMRLVRQNEAIPPAASRIDDALVVSASPFAEVWPALADFIGGATVVGHTLGFELAVLERECERAALPWRRPRSLDTRLLAQVIEPNLAGFTLEQLAAWLEVAVESRRSTFGDAVTTARIFLALVPKLREGGIRTLAEAEQACRALVDALEEQHRAGWVEPVSAPSRVDSERVLQRIDSYPYRHRVADVMSAPPKFVAPATSVGVALARMAAERCSSLFVHPPVPAAPVRPAEAGIITERDVLRALAGHGGAGLDLPVERIMSSPLASVPAAAFVYRAIGRMSRLKVRHLGVVDEDGHLVGALSARDLLRLRAEEAVSLGDEIAEARDLHDLARAWAKLAYVAWALVSEAVPGRDVAAVISRELGGLTRAAALIAEQRMAEQGCGEPPCRYALAVLGSAGRGESLLAMDQDHAIVFEAGEPDGAEDRWFAILGKHVADILHEVGVPYCKGGVMAGNAAWRGSRATWRARIADWIRRSDPQDLLSVDIFFDMRAVHGDAALANALWRSAFDMARGQVAFAKLLAESAGPVAPALGLFGGFKTDQGRIDLKKAGLFGIVTMARVLAIRHHVVERSTPARLAGIAALGLGAERDIEALDRAHGVLIALALAQQVADIDVGQPPSNAVAVEVLSRRDRERLRDALEAVRHLDDLTRDLLFRD